jgi:hypothetical protein
MRAHRLDPDDLGAQSGLIGAPESVSTEAVLATPIGGSARVLLQALRDCR